jgi:hypothetical protein
MDLGGGTDEIRLSFGYGPDHQRRDPGSSCRQRDRIPELVDGDLWLQGNLSRYHAAELRRNQPRRGLLAHSRYERQRTGTQGWDQTMVRIAVQGIEAMYAEYQKHGGKVHPNGALQTKPWGTKEFGAIDPNGVCVTFQE